MKMFKLKIPLHISPWRSNNI